MSKEMTWVEAAIIALENSSHVWMTAPDLVREIQRTGIRDLKSAYPQAVRSLRSALNFQSRKEKGLFARREEECNIYFALRTRLKDPVAGIACTKKPHSGRLSPQVKPKTKKPLSAPPTQPLVNGLPHEPRPQPLPSSLLPLHPLAPTKPYTIEIDPSSSKPVVNGLSSEGNFCLPSPLQSLLGPIRTLHLFNESAPANHTCRPVRQARMRKSLKDQENSSPDAKLVNSTPNHEATPIPLPLPAVGPPPLHEVLRLETCHPVPSLLSEVACVRYTSTNPSSSEPTALAEEDPCSVQGERKCSGRFEIKSLDAAPTSSESDIDDEDDDDLTSMDTLSESGSESEDQFHVQPTPRAKLLMHKPLRRLSSSCSEGLIAPDEAELLRETSQMDVQSVAPPGRQNRPYSADLGRLQGANNSNVRASSRSVDSKSVDVMKKPSSNGFVSCASLPPLDQRRYVSSLFQPTSPLVGENMKLLLNMDAYNRLTALQKRKLQSLLPSVDRGTGSTSAISDSTFNNTFYGSALREWQEHIALGSSTPEYKAKIRGEEKRRTAVKPEDLWKQKFYEENWGDMKEGADDHRDSFPVPYYPHNHATPTSERAAACLRAIVDGYHRKDENNSAVPDESKSSAPSDDSNSPSQPHHPPTTDTLHLPTTTTTSAATPCPPNSTLATTPPRKKAKSAVAPATASRSPRTANKSKSSPSPSSSPLSGGKNHLVKNKPPVKSPSKSPRNTVSLLPSLLKSNAMLNITALPTITNRKISVGKKPVVVKRLGALQQSTGKTSGKSLLRGTVHNRSSGQYLTRLPPKLPYQTLLSALEQASKENTATKVVSTLTRCTPPSKQHTHSVFHDHFSLLSGEHVPIEFCLPIKNLTIKLSREIYVTCLRAQLVRREHSYSKTASAELKLSLPRSKIRTKENRDVGGKTFVLCSKCYSLYHTDCISYERTLCPSCATS